MLAIIGGLGAALAWTVTTVCSARASRMIAPASVLAWVMFVGFLLAAPLAFAGGIPPALHGATAWWLAVAGTGNVAGLFLAYRALHRGEVALVAPLLATEGAMAAFVAVMAGESLSLPVALTLATIAAGVALAAVAASGAPERGAEKVADAAPAAAEGSRDRTPEGRRHVPAAAPALGAALSWGLSLYGAGRAGTALPAAWVAVAARLVGVPLLALPLALAGRLQLVRRAVPLVLASGVCEVLGFYAYAFGARHGIAVAAVLSSQFGAFAALVGVVVLGERLTRRQLGGVVTALAGVAVLSALRS